MDKEKTINEIVEYYENKVNELTNRIRMMEDLNSKAFECLVKASLRADALSEELNSTRKYRKLEQIGKE